MRRRDRAERGAHAISRSRPVARTSSRLATLAQAIRSTKPPRRRAPRATVRASLTNASPNGSTLRASRRPERVGELLEELLLRRREARLRLLERDARLQPAGRLEVMALIGARRDRAGKGRYTCGESPKSSTSNVAEDADDVVRLAAQRHRAADHVGIAVEPARPEAVADHDDAAPRRAVFVGGERRVRARRARRSSRKKLGRHLRRAQLLGQRAAGVVDDAGAVGRRVLDRPRSARWK